MAQRWHTDSWFLGCISSLWRNSTRHGKGQTAILAPLTTKNLEKNNMEKVLSAKVEPKRKVVFLGGSGLHFLVVLVFVIVHMF